MCEALKIKIYLSLEIFLSLFNLGSSVKTTINVCAVMVKYTPLERSSPSSSLICYFPFIHHQFIIKVHMGCGALLHCALFSPALLFYELKEGRAHALVRLVVI